MNNKVLLRSILFICICSICIDPLLADSIDTKALVNARLDSLLNATSQTIHALDRHYVSTLEKTNTQLNLYLNPYAIFIAALGVLFAAGAITAGILIYFQGSDFKKKQDAIIEGHNKNLEDAYTNYRNNFEKLQFDSDQLLQKLRSAYDAGINSTIKESDLEVKNFIYQHTGKAAADVSASVQIKESLQIKAQILLSQSGQDCTFYLRIMASNQKIYWLGFDVNNPLHTLPQSDKEYRIEGSYDSMIIKFQKNIWQEFQNAFTSKIIPLEIVGIRFRASNKVMEPVKFQLEFLD